MTYQGERKPYERPQATGFDLAAIAHLPSRAWTERGISKETMERYEVKCSVDESTGLPDAFFYPYYDDDGTITGYKKRTVPKGAFPWIGKGSGLFGKKQCKSNGQFCLLVEGEHDVEAAWEMLSSLGKNYNIVSLPSGANVKQDGTATITADMLRELPWLTKHKKVAICLDGDAPGKAMARAIADMIVAQCEVRIVTLPRKDAGKMLEDGMAQEFYNCLGSAREHKPDQIVTGTDGGIEELTIPVGEGAHFSFLPKTSSKLGGFRPGEMTTVLAAPNVGKCFGEGTKVRMWDGYTKAVEDIAVGDMLMGDDCTPRRVLSLHSGVSELFKVSQKSGDDYVVNGEHILCLYGAQTLSSKYRGFFEVSVNDYLNIPKTPRSRLLGYKARADFVQQGATEIDPYFLGLWLGDGHSCSPTITNMDQPIVDRLHDIAARTNHRVHRVANTICYRLASTNGTGGFGRMLLEYNLINNKHIPHEYLTASREVRMQVLAGLVDSDGYTFNAGVDIVQKNETLARDIVTLVRSLGMNAHLASCYKSCTYLGEERRGKYWRAGITGDTFEIPVVLERKRPSPRTRYDGRSATSVSVSSIGEGQYYGFEVDGNKRFLLEDFTVVHNSSLFRQMQYSLLDETDDQVGCFFLEENIRKTKQSVVAYHAGIPLARYRKDPSLAHPDVVKDVFENYLPRLTMFESKARTMSDDLIERKIEYMVQAKGCKNIFLDHLSFVISGREGGDERRGIDNLMTRLARSVEDLQYHLFIVSHIKRGEREQSRREPQKKYPYWEILDMNMGRGSGAIEQLSHNILLVERQVLDPEEDNTRGLLRTRWARAREYGQIGMCDYLAMGDDGKFSPVEMTY